MLQEEADPPTLCWEGKEVKPGPSLFHSDDRLSLSVYTTTLSRPAAVWAPAPGLEGRVQLLGDVPQRRSLPANGSCGSARGRRTRPTPWFRWRHSHGGGGTGRQVLWAAVVSGGGEALRVEPLPLDLSGRKKTGVC